MSIIIRSYTKADLPEMTAIWNRVVEDGAAFPQTEPLTREQAEAFFAEQTDVCVAERGGRVTGLYILHPNNVGRCGHIANASYAVAADLRGQGIGEPLIRHSMENAKEKGFALMQFNAVVANNAPALHLYEKIGMTRLGTIPGGFHMPDGHYEDIVLFYKTL